MSLTTGSSDEVALAQLLNRPSRFDRGLTLTEVGGGDDSASGNDVGLDRFLNDYFSPSDDEDSPDSDIEISENDDDDFDLRMTDATAALDHAATDPAVIVADSAST
ncbi:hypothetical protein LSAT2_020554, partial [Lamellibrachia satsuma]